MELKSTAPSRLQLDLAAALAGLQVGSTTPDEVAEVMDRYMTAVAVRDREAQGDAMFGIIRNVFSRLNETPQNWHQATVFYVCQEGMAGRAKTLEATGQSDLDVPEVPVELDDRERMRGINMYIFGVVMVLVQSAVAVGSCVSASLPKCLSNDMCSQKGSYCKFGGGHSPAYNAENKFSARCDWCGGWGEPQWSIEMQPDHMPAWDLCRNKDWAAVKANQSYFGMNDRDDDRGEDCMSPPCHPDVAIAAWCDACVHPLTGEIDTLVESDLQTRNVNAMALFDWFALGLAALMVALTVSGELKDIRLCTISLKRNPPSKAWCIALSFLQGMRRWLFLPCLVIVIPFLLVTTGTSSLQICFNTIAILFLADVDNLVYAFFLAERVRARLEDVGRVQLTADDLRPLQVTKIAHVFVVWVNIMGCVYWVDKGGGGPALLAFTHPCFWIAGVVDIFMRKSEGVTHTLRLVVGTTAKMMLGYVGFGILFLTNFGM
eukprot:SAG31_NODE_459_length_15396_cov_5.092502_5_plen_489_part_00